MASMRCAGARGHRDGSTCSCADEVAISAGRYRRCRGERRRRRLGAEGRNGLAVRRRNGRPGGPRAPGPRRNRSPAVAAHLSPRGRRGSRRRRRSADLGCRSGAASPRSPERRSAVCSAKARNVVHLPPTMQICGSSPSTRRTKWSREMRPVKDSLAARQRPDAAVAEDDVLRPHGDVGEERRRASRM